MKFPRPVWRHSMAEISMKEGNTMYVYIESEKGLWTVGFYDPHGIWHAESDHDSEEAAALRVNYLNGGSVSHEP